MYIPTSEIVYPDLHADNLGFVFEWKGHLLRGIYHDSKSMALNYFDSGFIDRICGENLFPKTWISAYENDRFAFIIEHERITPVIDSTEWNYSMLYQAAKIVLKIAKIASEYGYNMIDCHSSNVLFSGTKPYYVDLGSFVPNKEGCSGWRPYQSFLRSYLHLIELWADGADQVVKRMLSPGIELNDKDYFLYKNRIFRNHPALLYRVLVLREKFLYLSTSTSYDIDERHNKILTIAKRVVNSLKMLPNQRISRIQRKLYKYSPSVNYIFCGEGENYPVEPMRELLSAVGGVVIFNNQYKSLYSRLLEMNSILSIVSVQEEQNLSEAEYCYTYNNDLPVTSSFYKLFNGGFYIRKQDPADRLKQDVALIPMMQIGEGDHHNAMVYISEVMRYSKKGIIILGMPKEHDKGISPLKDYAFNKLQCDDTHIQLYVVFDKDI